MLEASKVIRLEDDGKEIGLLIKDRILKLLDGKVEECVKEKVVTLLDDTNNKITQMIRNAESRLIMYTENRIIEMYENIIELTTSQRFNQEVERRLKEELLKRKEKQGSF